MRLVEIVELSNGGHNNVRWDTAFGIPPEGWAVIPNDMVCENFPFGKVEVEEVDGVMTVTRWTPGVMPEPEPEPEPEPADGELESRVTAVETEVDELTAAIEKGLSL